MFNLISVEAANEKPEICLGTRSVDLDPSLVI
jgi:hypothetical protein